MATPLQVEHRDWADLCREFRQGLLKPGEHLSICAPTGEGKGVTAFGLLSGRKFVLCLDQKGGDDTLDDYPGFRRTDQFPDRQTKRDLADGKPVRLILGSIANDIDVLDRNLVLHQHALRVAWAARGFTIYVPDLQLLVDRRVTDVAATVDKFLIAARNRKMSVFSDEQELTNISHLAHRMTRWFVIGFTRDADTIDRLARATGRTPAEMRGLVKALPEHHFLFVPKRPRDPIFVTLPDPLPAKRPAA